MLLLDVPVYFSVTIMCVVIVLITFTSGSVPFDDSEYTGVLYPF